MDGWLLVTAYAVRRMLGIYHKANAAKPMCDTMSLVRAGLGLRSKLASLDRLMNRTATASLDDREAGVPKSY